MSSRAVGKRGRVLTVLLAVAAVLGYCALSSDVMAQQSGQSMQGQRKAREFQTLDDAALAMAKDWQSGRKAKPIVGDDGIILFPFGQTMPTLTCSRMRACDVQMQGGEQINDVILGDKVNWEWAPTVSTEKGQAVSHVIVQPRDLSVETNAIITTNRRTYHLRLRATEQEGSYLNRVGWYYPEDLVTSWNARAKVKAVEQEAKDSLRVSDPVDPTLMDYNYRIEGDADFRPERVYNNGSHVYMEFSADLYRKEMPSLEVQDAEGKAAVVNYRSRAITDRETGQVTKFVIVLDRLASVMTLRLGSGSSAEKVIVTWGKKKRSMWSWGGGA